MKPEEPILDRLQSRPTEERKQVQEQIEAL